MDFNIIIDSSPGAARQGEQSAQSAAGPTGAGSQATGSSTQSEGSFSTSGAEQAARDELLTQITEEHIERRKRIDALKERHEADPPAAEASRLHEEEMVWRQRHLDVLRERHIQESAGAEVERKLEEEAILRGRWLEVQKERFEQDSAAAEAGRKLGEEATLRERSLELQRERYSLESAAVEAQKGQEAERLSRDRQMEVERERHGLPDAASDEARWQLGAKKEREQWQRDVSDERRKQDPSAAAAEDAGALGGLAGQLSGGKGGLGAAGKLAGMMPAAHQAGQAMAAGAGVVSSGAAGLAIAAADVVAKKMADDVRFTTEAIKGLGEQTQRLVQGDHFGMLKTGIEGTASAFEEIPIVGQVFGAHIRRVSETMGAFVAVQEGFIARAKELSGFSAPLAGATAQAEVRSLMGDIREADQLGSTMARLVEVQSRTSDDLRQIFQPVKEILLELTTLVSEIIGQMVRDVRGFVQNTQWIKDFFESLKDLIEYAREWAGLNNPGKEQDSAFDDLKNIGLRLHDDLGQVLGEGLPQAPNARMFPIPGGF